MRFSAQGMWGRGSYFAENSIYSLGFEHHAPNGVSKIMLALVTRGRVDDRGTAHDRDLKKPKSGCHSVQAVTQGDRISILYEMTARAYVSGSEISHSLPAIGACSASLSSPAAPTTHTHSHKQPHEAAAVAITISALILTTRTPPALLCRGL